MTGYRKLGVNSAHRRSMLRNLVTDLFKYGRIQTTDCRAKEARREALAYIKDEDVVTKLFEEIGPKYDGRNGGYTRILKLGPRQGDVAEAVFLELV